MGDGILDETGWNFQVQSYFYCLLMSTVAGHEAPVCSFILATDFELFKKKLHSRDFTQLISKIIV